ncbi:CHASE2 domain-containing protein [Stappia indica]|uniref:CHASE2 domain-containing protein n=1 Tax=Stappia indica TaxID=538381 RepID=UPI001CD6B226|nr:adenylate/guanylate cyclase domain-containing protein [Stappia indica]MCA1298204.1 adenylate/guanylate cyclase domain-containing protein [Stappia indica]
MSILRKKRAKVAAVTSAFLLAVVLLRALDPGFLTSIRLLGFDYYQKLWPRMERPEIPVRIVDIDERALAIHGQWPWSRDLLAQMTERLRDLGAAAIVYDIIFAEADRLSPHRFLPANPDAAPSPNAETPDRREIARLLRRLPDTDAQFAEAIATAPVVLGFAVRPDANGRSPEQKAGIAYAGSNPAAILPAFPSALTSLPALEAPAAGSGGVSLSTRDTGGIVRRIPMLFSDGTTLYPSLALEALRVAQGASGLIIRSTGASGEPASGTDAITDIKTGAIALPTTAFGELWVYFNADRPDRYVSAADLLAPEKTARIAPLIEGQIVFIGTSSVGLNDMRATPLGELVPGVSIHAQAAEQIIAGDFLSRPDWADGAELIATLLLGLIVIALVLSLGALWAAALGGFIAAALYFGAIALFRNHGLLVDPVYPTAANLFVVYAAATALLYFLTEREKRFVRTAFGQYLAPELVRRLEETPEDLRLGGEMRDMTILFMDVRGFTPISEQLTPTDLVAFLNALLSPLSAEIQARHGTIDKYIGDSIMAFWNAPVEVADHARLACRAALAMIDTVENLNAADAFGFHARSLPVGPVRIGIGLNTGEACVGNMGSDQRFNYSVIGDAVNVAARIESSCKAVGAECLVSEDTARAAGDFALLEAGAIPLKGKSAPVKLFALVGPPELATTSDFIALKTAHESLIAHIDADEGEAAARALATCRAHAPDRLSGFYDRFAERIAALPQAAEGRIG